MVSYEAFAVKMLGALRQEIIFARQQVELDRPPQWIGTPVIATSHTWENGKNQQSHQHPTIGEALLGEMSDVSRVLFPADAATAVESLRRIYGIRGVIGCIVASKRPTPCFFDQEAASLALDRGATHADKEPNPEVQLAAIGAYQLNEAMRATARLRERGVRALTTAIIEPGRFRVARDSYEEAFVLGDDDLQSLFPATVPRVLVSHTRPEVMIGLMRRIDGGPLRMRVHGYLNRGGTLDVFGMLFANRCTWAHLVASAAAVLNAPVSSMLDEREIAAVDGCGDPSLLR